MARHILIARRQAGLPSAWGRADWDGERWFDSGAISEHGGTAGYRATVIQSNLKALIETAIGELGSADLTIAPRLLLDLITRGNPVNLNVPRSASSVLVLCPIGQENSDHTAHLWVPVMIVGGRCHALTEQKFVAKKLPEVLREMFAADAGADIKSRNSLHDSRELWVRQGLKASTLCPSQFPQPVEAPPVDAEAAATVEERQAARARHARTRAASRKSAEAGKFNKKAGEKFAEQQAKRRAKTS